jgi:hypothetical protein
MGIAIILNEMCSMVPEKAEADAGAGHRRVNEPDASKCVSTNVNFLKAITTLSTIITLVFMLWQFTVIRHRDAIKVSLATRHIKYKPKGEQSPKESLSAMSIWTRLGAYCSPEHWKHLPFLINFAMNCIHTVPGLSFSVSAEMLGMQVEYRIEALLTVMTIKCCISTVRSFNHLLIQMVMLCRTVHIATLRKYQLLSQYLNMDDTIVVRNTQTIKLLNDPSINYSVLAMKLTLARRPMHFIFTFIIILFFISTYLIRASEVGCPSIPAAFARFRHRSSHYPCPPDFDCLSSRIRFDLEILLSRLSVVLLVHT